jgi:hypothetical protein
MGRKEKKGYVSISDLINSAVLQGISELSDGDKSRLNYYQTALDKEAVSGEAKKLYYHLKNIDVLSEKEKAEVFYNNMKDFVVSGEAFNPEVKEIFEKENGSSSESSGLEKKVEGAKGLFSRFRNKKNPDYVMKSGALQEMNSLSEGFDPEVSEIYQGALKYIQAAALSSMALDSLKKYGLIGDVRHYIEKRRTGQMTKEGIDFLTYYPRIIRDKLSKKINYQVAQNVAAVFLGFFGMIIIFLSGKGITGSVIGGISNDSYGLIGGILILFALLVFLKADYKKHD